MFPFGKEAGEADAFDCAGAVILLCIVGCRSFVEPRFAITRNRTNLLDEEFPLWKGRGNPLRRVRAAGLCFLHNEEDRNAIGANRPNFSSLPSASPFHMLVRGDNDAAR
jgi:hypothetical protein